MSRIGRAIRELLRPDPVESYEAISETRLHLEPFSLTRLYEPVKHIADALERMERDNHKRRRRPRIVECEHPELHEEVSA